MRKRRGGRRLEPAEAIEVDDAGAGELEHGLGEVGARDLGRLVLGPRREVARRVEPQAEAGAGPSGASGALGRRGARDLGDAERRQPRPRIVRGDPREARVDDGAEAVDGDAGLGDVGGEDDLPAILRPHGAILFGDGQRAVERQNEEIFGAGDRREGLACATDLEGAGQEHEDVAVEPFGDELADRARDLRLERALVALGQVLDRDVEAAALALDDLGSEEGGHRLGVEGGAHRDELEIGARAELEAAEERERDVGREAALVGLVEEDAGDAAELGIRDELAGEGALGDEADPRRLARRVLEAHRVADGVAGLLAELFRDAAGRHAGGEAAWLEDDDLAARGEVAIEEGARHPRRLAGARRRDEEEPGRGPEPIADLGQDGIDRQRRLIHARAARIVTTSPRYKRQLITARRVTKLLSGTTAIHGFAPKRAFASVNGSRPRAVTMNTSADERSRRTVPRSGTRPIWLSEKSETVLAASGSRPSASSAARSRIAKRAPP